MMVQSRLKYIVSRPRSNSFKLSPEAVNVPKAVSKKSTIDIDGLFEKIRTQKKAISKVKKPEV